MNLKECFMLSVYNLSHRKRYSLQMILNIFIISTIFIVLALISIGISKAYNNILFGAASQNYLYTNLSINKDGGLIADDQYKLFETATQLDYTDPTILRAEYNLTQAAGKEQWRFVNIKYVKADINGYEVQGVNNYTYDFVNKYYSTELKSKYTVPFKIQIAQSNYGSFLQNEKKEFDYYYPNQNIILYGKDILNNSENEIIISDYMLGRFGITSNLQSLLGQKISFSIDGTTVISDYKIVGIINSNIFRVSSLKDNPQIIISGSKSNYSKYSVDSTTAYIPLKNFYDMDKVCNILSGNAGVFKASSLSDTYSFVSDLKIIIDKVTSVFGILVILALILNLYSIMQTSIIQRTKNYGMLKAMGMMPKQILLIALFEVANLTIIAIFLAFIFSIIFISLLNSIINVAISISIQSEMIIYFLVSLIVCSAIIALLFCLEMFMLKNIKRKPVNILLKNCS